ncbi:hypothetical protein [Methanotorris formicicus]|uniref:Cysteine repeat modular protein 2 PbCRM2-related protein n=1 Tax=Methanotorris formicicus Mc-S-70 TaxID=647171 RepID=H1KYX5_9EURY|nr:hypothetical protein [Methanotorris formicicus]EHP86710.1 cysteine repeat modular protein 2 PbCRM2-related protein [Methanotorris formicicus Mc-S-70]
MYLAYFDEDALKYELLMASLRCSIAYNKLENYLLAGKYPIDEIKKAKEELEKELHKYVKEEDIKIVKENLNEIIKLLFRK